MNVKQLIELLQQQDQTAFVMHRVDGDVERTGDYWGVCGVSQIVVKSCGCGGYDREHVGIDDGPPILAVQLESEP